MKRPKIRSLVLRKDMLEQRVAQAALALSKLTWDLSGVEIAITQRMQEWKRIQKARQRARRRR